MHQPRSTLLSAHRHAWPAAAVVLLGACAFGGNGPEKPPPGPPVVQAGGAAVVVVAASQSGSQVVIQRPQALQVELVTDAQAVSHGYQWIVTETDPALLEAGEPRFERASRDVNAFESAGTTVWRFVPRAAGKATLAFALRKPRSLEPPIETVGYEVTVR